jgi:hypothetical protein
MKEINHEPKWWTKRMREDILWAVPQP